MSEHYKRQFSWVFIIIAIMAGLLLFNGWSPVAVSGDHEEIRSLREGGEIMPLSDLLNKAGLAGMKILEAELEREHGQLIYEIELLDSNGRVHEQYFDARSGRRLMNYEED